ncbi:peptide transporter family 1 [Calliopsis andreniformis]|uniref:peptide transporter family 1 n=1 Tax=Calliopsis andreniformis TaxID=337506 RepID=UPI003FCCA567
MVVEVASGQKLKYPKSVFFIISNEFCERFSFYGMRTVLTLYLRNQLNYSNDTSTAIYHIFTMFAYFFPIVGAILADSLLGKFRTIFYLSIIYAIGQFLLAMSAAPPIGLPAIEFSFLGLLLIAFGTGGIKPCVAAFGGDQFVLPQQERYLSAFFSLFYFSINFGSLISSFLTPVLRSDVTCFGQNSCYSLAFLVPAVLMTLSVVIFLLGKPLYKIVKPSGNVVVLVTKCISHAIYNKSTSKKGQKKEHWLDHAEDQYDKSFINDIKSALQVMKLFIPIPIFWALYDQQGSRWTIQASRMNGEIGSFLLQPDQMQVFNPFLVLAFIPLFETCIYPLLAKIGINTPLRKLSVGGLLAALSFVISAFVQIELEKTYPVLPSQGLGQVRVFNTLDCTVNMTIEHNIHASVPNLNMWVNDHIEVNGMKVLNYEADFRECKNKGYFTSDPSIQHGTIKVNEAKATSWVITSKGIADDYYFDSVDKSVSGDPLVRALFYVNTENSVVVKLVKEGTTIELKQNSSSVNVNSMKEIKSGAYDVFVNDKKVQERVPFKLGGVYTVVGYVDSTNSLANVVTVTTPNSLHILWMVPQYVVITMGEVMFSVTGLEFAFTQAPTSMKSLLQAAWQLTVALGNLIVVIIAEGSWFSSQTYEFLLFAGLMLVDIIIFSIMAKFYKYVQLPEEDTMVEEINMDVKNGTANPSYKDDEK